MTEAQRLEILDRVSVHTPEGLKAFYAISDEQISLAWSPEPPYESTGGSDCRPGGSCGLGMDEGTARWEWRRARRRFRKQILEAA